MIRRVVFLGSKELGLAALEAIYRIAPESLAGIVTLRDDKDPRTARARFEEFATKTGVPIHFPASKAESEEIIARLQPELCLVVCWYWLISPELLGRVPHGFMGIHNSLLPRYRGGSPLVWSLMQGEPEIGFSLFSFTEGMDDGPVWASRSLTVGPEEHIGDVLPRIEASIVETLEQVYPRILSGLAQPVPQDAGQATYCVPRRPEDGQLDWRQPAQRVFNAIRAQSDPYPGAFSHWNGHLVHIWRAGLFDRPWLGAPGQIVRVKPDGVWVIAGDHRVVILKEAEVNGQRGAASSLITTTRHRFGPAA